MKVISLLQPWASLVIKGVKKIETRSWATPYRGTLHIHASLGKKALWLLDNPPFLHYLNKAGKLPHGCIIGQVTLTAIIRMEDFDLSPDKMELLTLEERAFGDYNKGRFGWLMENPVEYMEPIFCRGHLRLWDYEED